MHREYVYPGSVIDQSSGETMCVCLHVANAELIAKALNAQEANRKRREGGAAVVCQGEKQNAPSAKDGGKVWFLS